MKRPVSAPPAHALQGRVASTQSLRSDILARRERLDQLLKHYSRYPLLLCRLCMSNGLEIHHPNTARLKLLFG